MIIQKYDLQSLKSNNESMNIIYLNCGMKNFNPKNVKKIIAVMTQLMHL